MLVFSTPALTAPLEITGRHLWVSIDTVDTDVMVRLTDVYPDGRSMLVLDGAARLASRGVNDALTLLTPGELVEVTVDLWSTSIILDAGHRLRLSVTSSNWPRFRASPNDGTSYGEVGSPQPVNVTLYHDANHRSFLEAPDPNREVSEVNLCQPEPTVDAGVPLDGSSSNDASVVPAPDGGADPGSQDPGCACAGAPASRGFPVGLLLVLLGALAVHRRRRWLQPAWWVKAARATETR